MQPLGSDEKGFGVIGQGRYHPVMKVVSPVRRALRIRTAFNLLGPLLNPARPPFGLIGIYSPSIAPLMAAALQVWQASLPAQIAVQNLQGK